MGQSQTLREKVNMLNSKILMPLMALSFILFNTVINLYIGERIETIQNLLAIAVLAVLAFWLLSDVKAGQMCIRDSSMRTNYPYRLQQKNRSHCA